MSVTCSKSLLSAEAIWRAYDSAELRLSTPLSERMLDLAGLRSGMHVLDLATGRGEPAVRAAHRVGPNGTVLGIDISGPIMAMARERADAEGVTNLQLKAANVETLADVPDSYYQAVLARWALMYLDAPVRALSAARQALSPGGLLVAATWAEPERVDYLMLPRAALERCGAVPPIDQNTPGEFYYADPQRLTADFLAAGLTIQHMEEIHVDVMEAQSSTELVAWARAFGASRLLKGTSAATQRKWERELVNLAEPYRRDGYIRLGGVSRIVVAA